MKNANSMAMVLVIAMLFAAACSTDTAATEAPATEATAENATEAPGTETATEAEEETEEDTETAEELPTLGIGYMFSNPPDATGRRQNEVSIQGAYLEVLPREKIYTERWRERYCQYRCGSRAKWRRSDDHADSGQLQMGIAPSDYPYDHR